MTAKRTAYVLGQVITGAILIILFVRFLGPYFSNFLFLENHTLSDRRTFRHDPAAQLRMLTLCSEMQSGKFAAFGPKGPTSYSDYTSECAEAKASTTKETAREKMFDH